MPKRKPKRRASLNLGAGQTYEIHFFVPGSGFKAGFYSGESKEQALAAFKRENQNGHAFWINPARGKALAGPQAERYLIWWKNYGRPDWEPHMIFVLNSAGNLLASIPNVGETQLKFSWELAERRRDHPNHKLEEVNELTASLIGSEILIQTDRFRDKTFQDWESSGE